MQEQNDTTGTATQTWGEREAEMRRHLLEAWINDDPTSPYPEEEDGSPRRIPRSAPTRPRAEGTQERQRRRRLARQPPQGSRRVVFGTHRRSPSRGERRRPGEEWPYGSASDGSATAPRNAGIKSVPHARTAWNRPRTCTRASTRSRAVRPAGGGWSSRKTTPWPTRGANKPNKTRMGLPSS